MSNKKQYLKSKSICKVTFKMEDAMYNTAKSVHLVGDFNNWNPKKQPMQKLKNGTFKVVLDLETGREYQYRYLVNNKIWENDSNADKYVLNPFGTENSCVVVV